MTLCPQGLAFGLDRPALQADGAWRPVVRGAGVGPCEAGRVTIVVRIAISKRPGIAPGNFFAAYWRAP